jgi:hypothetical protein
MGRCGNAVAGTYTHVRQVAAHACFKFCYKRVNRREKPNIILFKFPKPEIQISSLQEEC